MDQRDVNKQLLLAARYGDVAKAQQAIDIGADIDVKNVLNETPLQIAQEAGHDRVAAILADAIQRKRNQALFEAALSNSEPQIEVALNAGADINAKDANGWTALHHAVVYADHYVVSFLLQKGADPNARDDNQCTPLHLAASCRFAYPTLLLLEKGADANARDSIGKTPLELAQDSRCTELLEVFHRFMPKAHANQVEQKRESNAEHSGDKSDFSGRGRR
jgi:ankyrin repeat protein